MSTSGHDRPPKKNRREEAREVARQMRIKQVKRAKRRRLLLGGGIGVAVVAVIAVVSLVIVNNLNAPPAPSPANMASDGVVLGSDGTTVVAAMTEALPADAEPIATDQSELTGMANIVVYLDYLCPICGTFELANGPQITDWVTAGNATVEFHPISFLDRLSSGTNYSTRAANAAVCVANSDPNKFLDFNTAMFVDQPAENTPGLTDEQLTSVAESVGITSPAVASCITDQTFSDWVDAATNRALDGPIPNSDIANVEGTPTVLVNGVKYGGSISDAATFEAFVTAQMTGASQ